MWDQLPNVCFFLPSQFSIKPLSNCVSKALNVTLRNIKYLKKMTHQYCMGSNISQTAPGFRQGRVFNLGGCSLLLQPVQAPVQDSSGLGGGTVAWAGGAGTRCRGGRLAHVPDGSLVGQVQRAGSGLVAVSASTGALDPVQGDQTARDGAHPVPIDWKQSRADQR